MSLAITNLVDTLLEHIKSLMCDAAKIETRAHHLNELNERDIFALWATTIQPYPPSIHGQHPTLSQDKGC